MRFANLVQEQSILFIKRLKNQSISSIFSQKSIYSRSKQITFLVFLSGLENNLVLLRRYVKHFNYVCIAVNLFPIRIKIFTSSTLCPQPIQKRPGRHFLFPIPFRYQLFIWCREYRWYKQSCHYNF